MAKKVEKKVEPISPIVKLETRFSDKNTRIEAVVKPGSVTIFNSRNKKEFVFQNSHPDTIEKVANVLLEFAKLGRVDMKESPKLPDSWGMLVIDGKEFRF